LRASLGEMKFARVWEAGRTCGWERAVAEAMGSEANERENR
jgi:hypothetical protein